MRRVGDRARVVLVLACACTASEGGAPARAQADAQPAVVGTSTLPRLRRAWTATNLKTPQWRYRDMSPASDGALIAWGGQGGGELIAIELATGKPRWRTAATAHGPEAQIEFATGMVLVNPPSSGFAALDPAYRPPGETTAFDVKTGKTLWKAKLCSFNHHPVDNGAVGFGMCHGPPHVKSNGASGTTMLVAFELATGRELWRRPHGWVRMS